MLRFIWKVITYPIMLGETLIAMIVLYNVMKNKELIDAIMHDMQSQGDILRETMDILSGKERKRQ
jgi:hypothetical protein